MKPPEVSVLIADICENSLAYYVIRCLKESNQKFKINMLVASDKISSNNPWIVFYQNSHYVDRLIISIYKMNTQEYLNEVIKFMENTGTAIVFAASEEGFKFVSQYRNKLSKLCKVIALPSQEALDTAFDKWKLSLILKQNNVPIPQTSLLNRLDNFSSFNYPVIIKPINGSGGKNIQKFDKYSKEYFQKIINNKNEVYIIQEYIDGYDIDCNVLCLEGEVVAYTIQRPLGVEAGFSPKIDKLKFVHNPAVIDVVRKTMKALKWSGIAHLDLRYDYKKENFQVIEINPRFWQSLMGSLSVGVNFPYLLFLLTNNISFPPVTYEEKYYVKFPRFLKDAFDGTVEYNLSDTNIKYILSDINSVVQYSLHKFFNIHETIEEETFIKNN